VPRRRLPRLVRVRGRVRVRVRVRVRAKARARARARVRVCLPPLLLRVGGTLLVGALVGGTLLCLAPSSVSWVGSGLGVGGRARARVRSAVVAGSDRLEWRQALPAVSWCKDA